MRAGPALGESSFLIVISLDGLIREHLICLIDFLKSFLLAFVGIRMVLLCQLPERFLDVLLGGGLGHAEDLVVIFGGVEGFDGAEVPVKAISQHFLLLFI